MANVISHRSTHAGKLERYLGKEEVAHISSSMSKWHGTRPILVGGMPARHGVWVGRGGDFTGTIDGGGFASAIDAVADRATRAFRKVSRQSAARFEMAGFSSLSDLISEATTGGKKADYQFNKVGTTGVLGATNSLWRVGTQPAAGAAASNAPGGNVPTSATTGSLILWNPTTGGDTQHFVRADVVGTVGGNTLLMYDRIFEVNKTMASAAAESITGAPTRYQAITNTPDSADGNFLFFETQAALGATAHNWTGTYTDQDGNTGASLPSLTGNSACIANRIDHPTGQFFAPLASGDAGIRSIQSVTCSSATTGTLAVVIGHPIAFLPTPLANIFTIIDGINSAFNLTRIFDNAALGFLEVIKPSTAATVYAGNIATVAG